jgi:hypothetical protein
MSHYAKVNNGIVERVIVAEESFFDTFIDTSPGEWVQTSYNTFGGVHLNDETPLRKNFACSGFTYDAVRDAFYEPQPFNSWALNEDTCQWEAPTSHPADDSEYTWNEDTLAWDEVVDPTE